MVSSTDGSPTNTCWKRRSRAASFSMYLRYSSRVVAPISRSSPRASMGLIMLPASMAPSAAPAPTMVCSSSMKVMTSALGVGDLLQDGLEPLFELAAVLGPGHHRAQVQSDHPPALQALGDVAVDDPVGQALDDRRLAHAGLTDQHRVVLGPPGEHLDDPADLLVPADDRVELALAGQLGQVPSVLLEGGEGVLGGGRGHPVAAPHVAQGREKLVPGDPQRVGEGQQQVLDRQVVVAHVPAQLVGRLQPVAGRPGEGRLGPADGPGQLGQLLAEPARHLGGLGPDPGQEGSRRCCPAGPGPRRGGGPGSPRRGWPPPPAGWRPRRPPWS